jgi:hypothetical protein
MHTAAGVDIRPMLGLRARQNVSMRRCSGRVCKLFDGGRDVLPVGIAWLAPGLPIDSPPTGSRPVTLRRGAQLRQVPVSADVRSRADGADVAEIVTGGVCGQAPNCRRTELMNWMLEPAVIMPVLQVCADVASNHENAQSPCRSPIRRPNP